MRLAWGMEGNIRRKNFSILIHYSETAYDRSYQKSENFSQVLSENRRGLIALFYEPFVLSGLRRIQRPPNPTICFSSMNTTQPLFLEWNISRSKFTFAHFHCTKPRAGAVFNNHHHAPRGVLRPGTEFLKMKAALAFKVAF